MSALPYIPYTVTADVWDPDELGNHRAVIEVNTNESTVWTRVPWRRRDEAPERKGMLLFSHKDTRVDDYLPAGICAAYGDIVFSPVDGPGKYYLYFLPYEGEVKIPYPKAVYRSPDLDPTDWRKSRSTADPTQFPHAPVTALECVDEFNMFTEMELIADEDETDALYARNGDKDFLLFPEYRESSIRMFNAVPYKWTVDGANRTIEHKVYRGETYVFQVGFHAHKNRIDDVSLSFGDLISEEGRTAAKAADMRCFNTEGRAWDGSPLSLSVSVGKGSVQPLWCAVDIQEDALPGMYTSTVSVTGDRTEETIELHLEVLDEPISHHGDDDPSRLARLRWLDSELGTEDEIVPPFTPVEVSDTKVSILGRDLEISSTGLPAQITSYFTDDLNSADGEPFPLFSDPMSLEIIAGDGNLIELAPHGIEITEEGTSFVRWKAASTSDEVAVDVRAIMEFDGAVEYEIRVTAEKDITINDIRLTSAFLPAASRYMTGLGRKGGSAPEAFSWKWDPEFNQDAVWIGSVNGGVQITLKDKGYSRPLNTNFYHLKPLLMPRSWANSGKGTIHLNRAESACTMICSSGPLELKEADSLDFDLRLLISPFKPIDTAGHFSSRYFHQYLPVDDVLKAGANTINIHHCTDINPYINYPFLTPTEMKEYIDEAHQKDCAVKLYYTVRELTTRTPEIFALKSLGHEIFVDGEGGGHAWLQEHFCEHYIAAWYSLPKRDTSAINGILSRWHNFYVEGMNWLAENLQIDGVYIDDLGFGREIMKRVKRVLHRHRDRPIIDLHSANQYNERDGFASSANLYMEHFPFLDRLWFGEYFDYDENPDYWLVEISGIPFGLMGEMLQDGGNLWRGMLFGMTGRMPRVTENQELWKMWDAYGLPDARMTGFWSDSCPVKVDHPDVLATVYRGEEHTVIALASWAETAVAVLLDIDWDSLAIAPGKLHIPEIVGFQNPEPEVVAVPIEPAKGKLVVVTH